MNKRTSMRIGGYAAVSGAIMMIAGAVLWIASGTDLELALLQGQVPQYLAAVGEARHIVVANLSIWIIGVLTIGVAALMFSNLSRKRPEIAQIARYCYFVAVPLVTVAYMTWLAFVVQLAPQDTPAAVLLAETIGWFASRADWLATILVLGAGPALLSLSGRGEWVTRWLGRWSIVCAIAALLTLIALFTGDFATYGFVIIPVGLAWFIAAGIITLRRAASAHSALRAPETAELSTETIS